MNDTEFEIQKRKLPKLMACMTKTSLENMRNRMIFSLNVLDAKGVRRHKLPLHECLILELKETGFTESSDYLQDLIYDNMQLVAADDIGIVVDLRKNDDYLEHISAGLQRAEKQREKDNTKKECLELLNLALHYQEKGKGILWLAEKLFLAAIAVSSKYLVDGGRQKNCCKYHYAKFLLDKFPDCDPEEPFITLTEVRDCAIGKTWPLYEPQHQGEIVPSITLFSASAIQLHRVLLSKAKAIKKKDPEKAERLARLAERRAKDAGETDQAAHAIIEIGVCQLIMNNLNNAQKTFERSLKVYTDTKNIKGLCDTKMHMAAVMQKLNEYEKASNFLTEMGAMAMDNGLRRELGRALHLLGELHLRRERPELGTHHLAEAFACFMGFNWAGVSKLSAVDLMSKQDFKELDIIYKQKSKEIYEEEAEQSRLMMAISAGQELMATYFKLLNEASNCAVAQIKTIEWKLSHSAWWIKRHHHDFLPCLCPQHRRTPLDVLRIKIECKERQNHLAQESEAEGMLGRMNTVEDIRKLRSSYRAL